MQVLGGEQLIAQKAWTKAFAMGGERTFEQDPKYAIPLMVDIAITALSPGSTIPPLRFRRSTKSKTCCCGSAAAVWKSALSGIASERLDWLSNIRPGKTS
jgi:hypothetical protein